MEIEAKFSLHDPERIQAMVTTTRLAGFRLGKSQSRVVKDTYLDTAGRTILAEGYTFRLRQEPERILVTLKGTGKGKGAIHKREEEEIFLPGILPVNEWPDCPLKSRILELTQGETLNPLFDLDQTRVTRPVRWKGEEIAELSIDKVHVSAGDAEQSYDELEVELKPQGNEEQLAKMISYLQDKWHLPPEAQSKFERALNLLDHKVEKVHLPAEKRAVLSRIAERNDWHGLRSRTLLYLDEGVPSVEVSKRVGRARRTIRRWAAEFRRLDMAIFPDSLLEAIMKETSSSKVEPALIIAEQSPAAALPIQELTIPGSPGVLADDSMAEVTRKVLLFHFLQMLSHEPGTLLGENIEELHDMRVATRRMRAALQVFGKYLNKKKWMEFEPVLREVGRTLGRVRDMDVFWDKTQLYLESLPSERKDELVPLQAVWQAEHDQARKKLASYLKGETYLQFKDAFLGFLQTPDAGSARIFSKDGRPQPSRLRHLAAAILYQQLATIYAFDEWISGPDIPLGRLHQLRIASKGLRYSLEFLQEVLGKEVKSLIEEMKTLQDHLGNLQDAVVASNLLRDFMIWGTWGHERMKKSPPVPIAPVIAPGVALYLAYRQAELQELPASFPQIWKCIQNTEFREKLASALKTLS